MSQVGTLYIVSAPSGAGKSTLINALLAEKRDWPVQVSVSHTTRAPRVGEKDGEHYHFVDVDTFKQLIAENAFFLSGRKSSVTTTGPRVSLSSKPWPKGLISFLILTGRAPARYGK